MGCNPGGKTRISTRAATGAGRDDPETWRAAVAPATICGPGVGKAVPVRLNACLTLH